MRNKLTAGFAAVLLVAAAGCSSVAPITTAGSGQNGPNSTPSGASTSSGTSASAGSSTASAGASSAPAGFQSEHKGGTLKLLASGGGGTVDTQINYTNTFWQLFQNVYDGLVKFHFGVDGAASDDVVPDLATAMPKVTNDGKTYTFTLRQGIKFSNGQPVTVADVLATFQRLFKVSSPNAASWYSVLVGADACLKTPASCTLDGGVVVDPTTNQVQFNLTKPDAEFIYQLAVPFAAIIPKDSPAHDVGSNALPSTGPYMIKSYNPTTEMDLVRNPNFQVWAPEAQPEGYPDEIQYQFTLDAEAEVSAVENGQADWMFDPPPADRLSEIGTKYANQVHVNPQAAFWYVPLNTNLPPFNNIKARQAINWAVDRNAVVQLFGGSVVAQPVCTILPPGFPGHVDNCQYTKGGGTKWAAPDLAKAKELVKESGTAGQEVTVIAENYATAKSIGEYMQSLLNELGYKANLKLLSENVEFTYIQNTNNKVQLSVTQWYQDYPAASDFLQVLLSCQSFHPGSDASINIAGFCDKSINTQMDQAEALMVNDPTAGNALWSKVDQEMMAQSPIVPLFTPHIVDFLSPRVGNYHYSNVFFMCIDQLWVK